MSRLRKRGYTVKPKTIKLDPLVYVQRTIYKAFPQFKKTEVERDRRRSGVTIRGSWPPIGRQIYDWELEFEKQRNNDVITKINLWGRKGTNFGETYVVSIARAAKLANKIATWVDEHIRIIKEREKR
jgi:hypothetical protein